MKQDYEKLIRDIGFRENKIFKKDFINGIVLVQGEIVDKKVMLKVYSSTNYSKIKGIENENRVDLILEKWNKKTPHPIKKINVILSGNDDKIAWVVRDYFDGAPLADPYYNLKNSIIPDRLTTISGEFIYRKEEIIDLVIKQLLVFQKIQDQKIIKFRKRFKDNLEDYSVSEIEKQSKIHLSNQVKFFAEIKSKYQSLENQTATINDLNLSNILILEKTDEPLIFDLEWLCQDNCTMDMAFLWLFLWRYSDTQLIINNRIIKSHQEEMFRASVLRIMICWFNDIYSLQSNQRKNISNIRKQYNKHIWTKYLVAAGESYDKLINVRN